jgi:hypothetical protein
VSAAEIRAWAAANGIDCPPRGRIPNTIAQAYADAHPDPLEDEADDDPQDEESFTIDLHIPGTDPDTVRTIEGYLLEAVWHAFRAGQEAERQRITAALGVQ